MFRRNATCCRKKSQQAIMSKQLGPGASCYGYGHCSQWGEMEINFLPTNWNSELSASLAHRSMSLPPHRHPSNSSDVAFNLWIILWLFPQWHWLLETREGWLTAEMNYFILVIIHIPLRSNPQIQGWKSWTCTWRTVHQSFCIASVFAAKQPSWSSPAKGIECFHTDILPFVYECLQSKAP